LLCLLAVVATTAVACGSGSEASSTASTATTKAQESRPVESRPVRTEVRRADAAEVGLILFDKNGFTLYSFDRDKGMTSTCYGACAERWPPLLTKGKPIARAIYHTKIGTTKRRDGAIQVTYAGHPLYSFTGDSATGDTNGNGLEAFGGEWHALHPSGEDAETQGG
jgi:predicted lipoprotein with Yx(FWY)xxD motif